MIRKVPDCGDFGPGSPTTSSETNPFCYPGYCVKMSGKTAAGEAWTNHYCPAGLPDGSIGNYGCRKLDKDECNEMGATSCEKCVCGTDL